LPFAGQILFILREINSSADAQGEENKSHTPNIARARNSGNAFN